MRSSSALSKSGAAPKLTIGQVLHRLAEEYPDLAPSKIRFLEDQKLISPARTPSGYRKFSNDDVERIRTILSLQRNQYLPLKVIREYLDALDRGEQPELKVAPAPSGTAAPSRAVASMLTKATELTREELLKRTGASRELLEQAMTASLLPRTRSFGEDDVAMLSSLVELDRRGIGPRHLRPFRTAAQHEAGLIEQAVSVSRRADAAAREKAQRESQEIAGHLEVVRRSLVRGALNERNS